MAQMPRSTKRISSKKSHHHTLSSDIETLTVLFVICLAISVVTFRDCGVSRHQQEASKVNNYLNPQQDCSDCCRIVASCLRSKSACTGLRLFEFVAFYSRRFAL